MMEKLARNEPCSCGSGKKYKKCCLNREIECPVKIDTKGSKAKLVKTLTGEFFQPMRLYYTIYDADQLKTHLSQLNCTDYDDELDDWTVRYEAEAASIRLTIPPHKVPSEVQPLIIATLYIEKGVMLVDVRSIERAARMIEFLDKHIPRTASEITAAAIYNKLVTTPAQDLQAVKDIDYDDIFNEQRTKVIDTEKFIVEINLIASQYADKEEAREAAFRATRENAKKQLPEVEKFPTHYYEEGISHFEIACRFRQMIALQHYLGKADYSLYDLTQELVRRQS